jgi:hypothetical protein
MPLKQNKSERSRSGLLKVGTEIVGEIEGEPIQGWLGEHYQLMKNEVCELSVRLTLLD